MTSKVLSTTTNRYLLIFWSDKHFKCQVSTINSIPMLDVYWGLLNNPPNQLRNIRVLTNGDMHEEN